MTHSEADKILDALERKYRGMSPCRAGAWHQALAALGICADPARPPEGRFFRISDPMGVRIYETGHGVRKMHGILYVPEEVADKILVLGCLP